MNPNRSHAGGLIAGAVLIAFGLLSVAGQIFDAAGWGVLWPLFVIGIGALFFVAMYAGGKGGAGFAVPGSIVGGLGLVLLFESLTKHWEMMAYFWTLIVFFVGVGIYIMGWYGENASQKKSGTGVMKIGIILFVVFGAFFESIFSSFDNLIFPILLILLGGYLVFARSGFLRRKSDEPANPTPPLNQ